jgi:hypothetical protein
MWYKLTEERGYLRAELFDRQSVAETREFLTAVEADILRHRYVGVLISVHSSNSLFSVGKVGAPAYFDRLARRSFKIALLGDSDELRIAHEYVETLARQRNVALRAFRDEAAALRWLREPATQDSAGPEGDDRPGNR